jgi:hypothetical protein
MRALVGELLLKAFERGMGEHELNRALTMLSLAIPECSREQLAEVALAQRDLLLLQVREITFGPVMRGFGICRECRAQLEFTVPVASFNTKPQLYDESVTWNENGNEYQLRALNSNDLLATLDCATPEEAQHCLLARCLSISTASTHSIASTAEAASVQDKFDELHAAAEFICTIECPECACIQALELDIGRFLWLEVRSAAQRLLSEIHELAWAYGWSEQSIARMSSERRNSYMEMLSA